MIQFRAIKSPVALAACGAFLVPEPFGTCIVLAAAIWWLCRRIGGPCHTLLSFWGRAVRRLSARLRRAGSGINIQLLPYEAQPRNPGIGRCCDFAIHSKTEDEFCRANAAHAADVWINTNQMSVERSAMDY